jgi:hypothetical protein
MKFHTNAQVFAQEEVWPLLMWESAPAAEKPKELIWGTVSNYKREPSAHDPLVFRIRKADHARNAFGVGITLGRTPNNDLAVEEPSISRFHAYFQLEEKSGIWHLADAESFNGTFCEGNRLVPNRPAPLHDQASVRFGFVTMRFMLPKAFETFLLGRSQKT